MNYNRELAGGARTWYSSWLLGWKQEEKNILSVVIMRGLVRGNTGYNISYSSLIHKNLNTC
jgi:hypothetical protein